ncbi:MAG: S24/S26 family peptidase [Planctomycetota bacterium]
MESTIANRKDIRDIHGMEPAVEPVLPLPMRDLVLEALGRGKPVRLGFQGTSMTPLLRAGDTLLVGPPPKSLHLGDIVLYRSSDVFVVHRVIRREIHRDGLHALVKGDFTPQGVQRLPPGGVLGRVLTRRRGEADLDLRSPPLRVLGVVIALLSPWAIRWGLVLPRQLRHGIKKTLVRIVEKAF